MTSQVEVITSVQRRRRWSRAEKERIVSAAIEPGAIASEVARQAGIHQSQLFRRRDLCGPRQAEPGFVALAVATDPGPPSRQERPLAPGLIEVEFAAGARVRIAEAVDAGTLSAVIEALAKSPRRR